MRHFIQQKKRYFFLVGIVFLSFFLLLNSYVIFFGGFSQKNIMNMTIAIDSLVAFCLSWFFFRYFITIFKKNISKIRKKMPPKTNNLSLYEKMVLAFGLMVAIPTLGMTLFSIIFFSLGIETWLGDETNHMIQQMTTISTAYLEESKKTVSFDALNISRSLNANVKWLEKDHLMLQRVLELHAERNKLKEAIIFSSHGYIKARYGVDQAEPAFKIDPKFLDDAQNGKIVFFGNRNNNRLRALIQLDSFEDSFLFVGREVNPTALEYSEQSKNFSNIIHSLEEHRSHLSFLLFLIFSIFGICLFVITIFLGERIAKNIANPIFNLLRMTKKIKQKGLNTTELIPEKEQIREFNILTRSFQQMALKLSDNHAKLQATLLEMENKHNLLDAVLGGASSTIIGVDSHGVIKFMNHPKDGLEKIFPCEKVGENILEAYPHFSPLLEKDFFQIRDNFQTQKITQTLNGEECLLRISLKRTKKVDAFVLTIENLSHLIHVQRLSLWSDIARRLAHEIMNPLSTIRLSVDRLDRKYADEIVSDPEVFATCIKTVCDRVESMRDMVQEFSEYAKMPSLNKKMNNLSDICREAMLLEKVAYGETHDINYSFSQSTCDFVPPDSPTSTSSISILFLCDQHQISRLLINLLKNAHESVIQTNKKKRWIQLRLSKTEEKITIEVEDNGVGFGHTDTEELLLPYVSTKEKGTGLGLSIAEKIVKDHNGRIELKNSATDQGGEGALIKLTFYITETEESL